MQQNESSYSNYLTTGDVARIFQVHPCTIRRWCDDGKIESYRTSPNGFRRFRREDVAVAYLNRTFQRYFQNPANPPESF